MAGLENLIHIIYHEKQQQGSMLCAQHALNSLLRILTHCPFTAPDLSDIARNLDTLEHSYDESHTESTNMDDSGFFSVQVLDNALKVWGLNLTRWRGEEMRPYHDHPHTQLAFILNLDQHWFTVRRFGDAEPNINDDPGNGHWFNLNSFFPEPEWVGKLYLGMVLQQAEAEGYSVFAVTQADPSAPLALPRTDADVIASTLPEPTSAGRVAFQSSSYKLPQRASTTIPSGSDQINDFEDEDYELQAALQASLMGGGYDYDPPAPPPLRRTFTSLPPDDSESPTRLTSPPDTGIRTPMDDAPLSIPQAGVDEELDPVAASMERNRLMLQRMRAEQEFAQRELWGEGSSGIDAAALESRRVERRREEEEEAEQLRLAIAESEVLARVEGNGPSANDEELDDTDMDVDQSAPKGRYAPGGHAVGDRVYDDDDAELQAALKASLEQVPHGWELPELPSQRAPVRAPSATAPSATLHSENDRDAEDVESVLSDETAEHPSPNIAAEAVSVDDLRRRRLARFGA
ncbi:Josephin-domain-containing protein [Lyophyllum atratum]|nr:Josephin-domain-containing protein [Lyophyllum atratum]